MAEDRVCVGAIAGAFGVRGEVRLKSFCALPGDIAAYGPLWSEDGARRFEVMVKGQVKNGLSARLSGVATKEQADALRGVRLYAPRDALPNLPDDEYYHADLIGLEVTDTGGTMLGRVKAVLNHGASDLLEVQLTLLAVGDVDVLGHPVQRCAGVVAHQCHVDLCPHHLAVGPQVSLLHRQAGALTREQLGDLAGTDREVVGVGQLLPRPLDEVGFVTSEEPAQRVVDPDHAIVGVHDGHADGGVVHDDRELLLASPERGPKSFDLPRGVPGLVCREVRWIVVQTRQPVWGGWRT